MTIAFDFSTVRTAEFGIGRDDNAGRAFCCMPIDREVSSALQDMAQTTWKELDEATKHPSHYEPAEKHASIEYLVLPLSNDLATSMRELHQANNLPLNTKALDNPAQVFCYFARLTDRQERRLTALRRATQFKGVLKNRLLRLATDALKIVEDKVFKLDADFDLLIDKDNIHILRPAAFEFAGQLQQAVMDAVPTNIALLQADVRFVDFASIERFARTHPRAARYLASIRAGNETKNVDKRKLVAYCKRSNVNFSEQNGRLHIEDQHIMGFLEVLDRRRYEVELVAGKPEHFRALSRHPLLQGGGKKK